MSFAFGFLLSKGFFELLQAHEPCDLSHDFCTVLSLAEPLIVASSSIFAN